MHKLNLLDNVFYNNLESQCCAILYRVVLYNMFVYRTSLSE